MNKRVGPGRRASSAVRTQRRHFAIFPHVTDEQNSASVELVATTDWMRLFHAMAAKQKSTTSPVMSMGCVKTANQFIPMDERKWRKIGVFFQERKGDVGKIIER